MLSVTGFYLPGTTEPEPWPEMRDHLERRHLDTCDGGADLMFGLVRMAEFPVIGPRDPTEPGDLRNRVIASCLKHNCMSVIHWVVEWSGDRPWSATLGVWNEVLGVGVLDLPHYRSTPYVWVGADVEAWRGHFRLERF